MTVAGARHAWPSVVCALLVSSLAVLIANDRPSGTGAAIESCFLLKQLGGRELRRRPSEACRLRLTPASTFKVPHALAALDAGVVTPDEILTYDGTGDWPDSARRDHTMESAIQNSVLWFFQRMAERLGADRERTYLHKFNYGNMDSSGELTRFWIGGSLLISPEEQLVFWTKLYDNGLQISPVAVKAVQEMLIEPPGYVTNASGRQPFDHRWGNGVVVSGKTGSATDRSGQAVRWLVGHIRREKESFVFVSCVTGPPADVPANAAIDLAARELRGLRTVN